MLIEVGFLEEEARDLAEKMYHMIRDGKSFKQVEKTANLGRGEPANCPDPTL